MSYTRIPTSSTTEGRPVPIEDNDVTARDDSPLLGERPTHKAIDEDEEDVDGSSLTAVARRGNLGTAGYLSSIANLCNTILGTGMLAMPHAVSTGGLIPGIIAILFSGFTSALGLYYLSRAASKCNPRQASFFALSKLTFPSLAIFFDAAIALKCFGVSISYLIIIGALMPKVILGFTPASREVPEYLLDRRLWITLSMTILVPLAFLRKLDSLRHTSYIALIAVADLVIVVVFKFISPAGIPPREGDIELIHMQPSFVATLPVYIFAFTCAQNLFSVYNEHYNNSQKAMNTVILTSITSATGIYEVVGILGYLTFGSTVPANIMEAYPPSLLVAICRVAITVLVLFSYPLQLHPCRASLDKVFHLAPADKDTVDEEFVADPDHGGGEIPLVKFISMTSAILLSTFIIAIYVTRLELVLGFVGSTGSTTISFTLPSIFYISLFRLEARDSRKGRLFLGLAWFLLIYGVSVTVICLTVNIQQVIAEQRGVGDGKGLRAVMVLGGGLGA